MNLASYNNVQLDKSDSAGAFALAAALYNPANPVDPNTGTDSKLSPKQFADKVYQSILDKKQELHTLPGSPANSDSGQPEWHANLPSTLVYAAVKTKPGLPPEAIRVHYNEDAAERFSSNSANDFLDDEARLLEQMEVAMVGPLAYAPNRLSAPLTEVQLLLIEGVLPGNELHWIAFAGSTTGNARSLYDPVSGYAGTCTTEIDQDTGSLRFVSYPVKDVSVKLAFCGVWIRLAQERLPD